MAAARAMGAIESGSQACWRRLGSERSDWVITKMPVAGKQVELPFFWKDSGKVGVSL